MKTFFRWTLLTLTIFWLVGCGLKGPLYFPAEVPQAKELAE